MFSCDKCRLHFLFIREFMEHKLLNHRTHLRPPQLSGLKPGTKVHLSSSLPPTNTPFTETKICWTGIKHFVLKLSRYASAEFLFAGQRNS